MLRELSQRFMLMVVCLLILPDLPRVLNMPHTLYLPRGMEGHIECPVEANPPVTQVVWTQNEKRLNDSKRLKVGRGGTLLIKSVTTSDEGRYTCTPYSPRGAGRSSTVVQVFVKDPPHFVVRPKPYYQRQIMNMVIMPCIADGDPPPEIIWRKADNTFPPKNRVERSGGNLTIVNLDKEDHGTYECVAKNVVTSVITSTLLIIELTTPHAPYNVTVETTDTKAKISWLPAYDGGYQQHYVLWYRMQGTGSEEWLTLRVPDEATSITLYELVPGKTYQFCILSRNRMGDGLFSNIVTAQTEGYEDHYTDRPPIPGSTHHPTHYDNKVVEPAPPRNVTVRKEDGGLLISWLPPLNTTVPVKYYDVMYRTVGRWVPLAENVVGKTWYKWQTVSRGAQYLFKVYSFGNNSIEGSPSQIVTYFTADPLKAEGMSNAMIGGVVGGLIFLFIAVILAVMAIKFFSKRRQRERAARYGNVKYFGPKQVEANKKKVKKVQCTSNSDLAEAVL